MKEDSWIAGVMRFMRLTHEKEEDDIIHQGIEKAIVFRGTNLWILIFAIVVASVGLNMNSTAVVIGAMLISPIMGPINGVGYSVATYNFDLLRKSLKNLAFAAGAGLAASTLYFLITPIHTEHSELLARTSPTIYDVIIAIFGGLAGIVAISSKNKGNVIPGVAIATALMPPLCTAGYGLSIANWSYFFGAMYLFLINSVFIALASMVVSQLLNLPKKSHLLSREIKNKNLAVLIVAIITIAPSFYLGVTLVRKERFQAKADKFVKNENVILWEGNYLLKSSVDSDQRKISLTYGGSEFDELSEQRLREKANDIIGEEQFTLKIDHGFKIADMVKKSSEGFSEQQAQLKQLQTSLLVKEHSYDSLQEIPRIGQYLLREIKPLYPQIETCTYASTIQFVDSTHSSRPADLVYFTTSDEVEESDKKKIRRWLVNRLKSSAVIVKF